MSRLPRRTRSSAAARALAVASALAVGLALASCADDAEAEPAGSAASQISDLSIVVPADPGGGWDQTGRAMQTDLLAAKLVTDAEVTNIGGAGGTVGLAKLKTEKNPETLMVMGLVMLGAVETNKSAVRVEDTTPIAKLTEEAEIVVVPKNSPYATIQDLLADQKDRGRAVSITGGSAGGTDNMLAAQLLLSSGVPAAQVSEKLNYIPYSGGGDSVASLLGGKVSAGISGVGEYAEHVKSGDLKALAVSSEERSELLPDVPTLKESGVDLVLTNWRGVVAPGGLDDAQRNALVDLVTKMQATSQWQADLKKNGWVDAFMAGDEFDAFVTKEIASVKSTLQSIGLT